jgi:hypothetical protein
LFFSYLDTLAQTETPSFDSAQNNRAVTGNGNGSDVLNSMALKERAKRKMVTQKMILSLIDVCKKNEDLERQKSYWNSYHCLKRFYLVNGDFMVSIVKIDLYCMLQHSESGYY